MSFWRENWRKRRVEILCRRTGGRERWRRRSGAGVSSEVKETFFFILDTRSRLNVCFHRFDEGGRKTAKTKQQKKPQTLSNRSLWLDERDKSWAISSPQMSKIYLKFNVTLQQLCFWSDVTIMAKRDLTKARCNNAAKKMWEGQCVSPIRLNYRTMTKTTR